MFMNDKKLVLGNKKDLLMRSNAVGNIVDRQTLQKLEINKHKLVSAMTNHGVQEALRALINDIHSDNILHKELHDEERKKGDEPGAENYRNSILLGGTPGPLSRRGTGGGGLLSMIPFFNCYSRDDLNLEDNEQDGDSDDNQVLEGDDVYDDQEDKRALSNKQGGCLMF